MATTLHTADGHAPARRSPASASPTRWTRPWRRCAATRSSSRRSTRSRRPRRRRPKKLRAKSVKAKDLAVFTRQFSVMIDAGLPLVQCLEILGTQAEDKNFGAGHPGHARRRRGRRVARRRHEDAPEDVRLALHQHDRRGRSGRHPRHDSQAARDLHREGGQAEGPGQVRDGLPGRGHRRSRRSSSASFCGRSFRPSRTLFAGLGAELPLPTRVVIALSNGLVRFMPFIIVGLRRRWLRVSLPITRRRTAG